VAHRTLDIVACALVALASIAIPSRQACAAPARTPRSLSFSPGQLIVVAEKGVIEETAPDAAISTNPRLSAELARLGLSRAKRLGPSAPRESRRNARAWLLHSDHPGFDPVAASRALRATGALRAATPNYRFGVLSTTPNDLFLIYQWYVDDGSYADIRLPFAWDLEQGDTSVVIAILDTGVDTSHPDLASQIWHNPGEIPGNGLDDDGNGLIDDYDGWDFGVGDNDVNPEYTTDPSGVDVGFHGTFCAGLAAAATNNDEGIAGAGWNCRIMPVKVSHPDSGITSEAIAGAFTYAVDEGASIISMSFGGPGDPGVPEFFQALADMATDAGVLCVAAAGNDGDSIRVYPAACDHVLAVGATDFNNARASFSNWGPWVDVAAPGSYMWSTICQNYTLSALDQLIYVLLFGWDSVNPYMYGDGTSFACPLTAGVCGLIRSRYPYLTPALVAQHLIDTGDAVAYDEPIGVKINAYSAVNVPPTAVAEEPMRPAVMRISVTPNPVHGAASIRFALPTGGRVQLVLFDAAGRRVRTLAEGPLAAGPHRVDWDGRGERGSRLPAGVYFARLAVGGVQQSGKLILLDR
jgi:subtilisin family serine protease